MPSTSGLRPRSLLAYLLLNPGPHPRARLAGRFWPDVLDTSARASLRSALWAVREALERVGARGLPARPTGRTSASAGDLPRSVDAEEFDRLAALGDARVARGGRRPRPGAAAGRSGRRVGARGAGRATATGW